MNVRNQIAGKLGETMWKYMNLKFNAQELAKISCLQSGGQAGTRVSYYTYITSQVFRAGKKSAQIY